MCPWRALWAERLGAASPNEARAEAGRASDHACRGPEDSGALGGVRADRRLGTRSGPREAHGPGQAPVCVRAPDPRNDYEIAAPGETEEWVQRVEDAVASSRRAKRAAKKGAATRAKNRATAPPREPRAPKRRRARRSRRVDALHERHFWLVSDPIKAEGEVKALGCEGEKRGGRISGWKGVELLQVEPPAFTPDEGEPSPAEWLPHFLATARRSRHRDGDGEMAFRAYRAWCRRHGLQSVERAVFDRAVADLPGVRKTTEADGALRWSGLYFRWPE